MSGSELQEQSASSINKAEGGSGWPECTDSFGEQPSGGAHSHSHHHHHLGGDNASFYVVKLRGLPWETTVSDLMRFLAPIRSEQNLEKDIYLVMGSNGRCNGEAYVQLHSSEEQDKVILELHGKLMGRRWIEIFKSTKAEMDAAMERKFASGRDSGGSGMRAALPDFRSTPVSNSYAVPTVGGGVIKLRGLPWGASEFDIIRFFSDGGFSVEASQIALPLVRGRASGEAYIDLGTASRAEEARRTMNRRTIGNRYIEIFLATPRDFADALRSCEGGPVRGRTSRGLATRDAYEDAPYDSRAVRSRPIQPRTDHASWPAYDPEPDDFRISQAPYAEYTVLRMRGLPFNATANSILQFFEGFSMNTILPTTVPVDGKPSGEAYVEFRSSAEAARAFRLRQNARMEHRYIELFPSSKEEMEMAANGWDSREIRARLNKAPAAF